MSVGEPAVAQSAPLLSRRRVVGVVHEQNRATGHNFECHGNTPSASSFLTTPKVFDEGPQGLAGEQPLRYVAQLMSILLVVLKSDG